MVAAILSIMAKLNAILKSERVNTWEVRLSLGKDLKMVMILQLKNIVHFAMTRQILKIAPFSLPVTTTLKLP